MKKLLLAVMIMGFGFSAMAQGLSELPENPDPNKCYVKCVTPDVYETIEETIVVKPAYKKLSIEAAEYKWVEETVVIKEACKEYEIIPAVYETVTVEYESEQGYNQLSIVEPTFEASSVKIEVYPAVARWEYAPYEGCKSDDPLDCQALCWREYDPQYETVPTLKIANYASSNTNLIGGKKSTYTKRVIKTPAQVREIEIPAETKVIRKRVLVSDEKTLEVDVAAETTTVKKQVLVKKGGVSVWEEVECELLNYSVLPINYEYGSARLTSASRSIIDDKLVKLMKDKPNIKVEISAHTDSRGSDAANLDLSERRAQSVVNYLMGKGINASRLVAKGFGESRLKNRCSDGATCTEQEHAVNRRTEFRILNF